MWKSGCGLWRQKKEIAQGCQGSTHQVLDKHTLTNKFQPKNAYIPNLFVLKSDMFRIICPIICDPIWPSMRLNDP